MCKVSDRWFACSESQSINQSIYQSNNQAINHVMNIVLHKSAIEITVINLIVYPHHMIEMICAMNVFFADLVLKTKEAFIPIHSCHLVMALGIASV